MVIEPFLELLPLHAIKSIETTIKAIHELKKTFIKSGFNSLFLICGENKVSKTGA
ncbi:hypothetical protein [Geofilum rubicundum]|uniref:hypothetical protein n=1 Tax=Geofilum rubicundum TaxID=472113 RepID=UPI0012F85CFE|nr:hypothetical protein [Geofilum rubicundum]